MSAPPSAGLFTGRGVTLKAGQDAQVTIATDVSRHVSGMYSDKDRTLSSFSFLATAFRVISGFTGMEWQDGYLRIWKSAAQLVLGHTCGFGDTVMWWGANVGAANST